MVCTEPKSRVNAPNWLLPVGVALAPCAAFGIHALVALSTELAATQLAFNSLVAVLLFAGTFKKVRVALSAPSAFNQKEGLLATLAGVTTAKLGVKIYLMPLPAPGKKVLAL